ncbi:MAG: TldD/PmbA family protein, partial [Chloroflexi bacterium]|nr:TldD/PmbA family protein [Chloroflexota bacterium]
MRDLMEAALKGQEADHLEIRIEETEFTHLLYRGRELEEVGRTTGIGGCIRAASRGGWGFVSFNDLKDLRKKVSLACQQARLVGSEKTQLAPADPVLDTVPPFIRKDPRHVSLGQKKALLDRYLDLVWSTPGIQTSSISYGDSYRKVYLATAAGSYISQERVDLTIRVAATARDGGDVQQASISMGSLGDFSLVEHLADEVHALAQRAVDMLKAPRIQGGEYTVVLDPVLAGVFIHEAFGHLSEADHVYENERLRELMKLGRRFGGPHLNVVDGGAIPGLRGSYQYDDEGVPATRTHLIREGVLVGRLHSRETAGRMGEKPTGNARAISHHFPPIVRMTNTFIEPGDVTCQEMIADIKEGVYARNWFGGMTSME